jgi:glycosyltransferase involved in cell wall biosynthesis
MSIKVCYVAGREATYSRTHNVIKALGRAGFEVTACLPPDRSKIHQPKLLWDFFWKKRGADVVVLGFYGQLLMPFVRLLTRKPILFDVYVSTYGTMVDDRGEASAKSLKAKVFWLADHLSMRLSTHMILESSHHIRRYAETYRVSASKFTRVFLPSDEDVVFRREPRPKDGRFRVHFHGEYAPFHGVDVVVRAAKALENDSVDFQIIGTGITYERDRKLAAELGVSNVEFIDRVPYEQLGEYMSRADVCLGFFSNNARADRLLTNKVVEAMAVGKPLITRRNDAVQELLRDGESVLLVEPDDPDALAAAILRLKQDPALAAKLGRNALQCFQEKCAQPVFTRQLKDIVEGLVYGHASLPEPAPTDHA